MDKRTAGERIPKLRKLIDYHRALYHTFDAPEVSDAAFDALKNELEELEHRFPDLMTSTSPTQVVGGTPLDAFVKVRHEVPMLSFNDAFSESEMREWVDRLENYLKHPLRQSSSEASPLVTGHINMPLFYCELKIDGLAIELVYENGKLIQGSTRGDGTTGEDITQNIGTIASIPHELVKLGTRPVPRRLVVRGEVYITTKEFEQINREQEKRGEKPYANPRNLAAGSVRQLDPTIAASRKLRSFQYDIVPPAGGRTDEVFATHEERHKALASWGFTVNPENRACRTLEQVFAFREQWASHREKLPYEIDGIVVIVNPVGLFSEAGIIGKAPRAAIAYKFSPREATTVVRGIAVQVGRTGALTPVAELEPVEVGGITITHATLHNADEIERLGVRIGDTVIVSRAGDVIPQVTQVLPELRSGREKKFLMPRTCPVDGSSVVREGVAYRCSNPLCGARHREALYHFVSRAAFAIDGLGPKIIDRLLDEGLISDAADIFALREGDIEVLSGFGKRSAENIVGEIRKRMTLPLARFLYGLGILHVGEETARVLTHVISKSQFLISKPTDVKKYFERQALEDLQKISDIGPKVSESIHGWFREPRNRKLLEKFDRVGVRIDTKLSTIKQQTLQNHTFVLTGTLAVMDREKAKEEIRARGGEVSESVSKKTSYVVLGNDPGSKYERARSLGVPTLTEEEFLKLIR